MKPTTPPTWPLVVAILLASATASHAVTGLLVNLGWYRRIGIDFHPWYANAAYQSGCWFALGIAATILVSRFVAALRRDRS